LQNHPDYWPEYRACHPEQRDRNREQERDRDQREPPSPPEGAPSDGNLGVAKVDRKISPSSPVKPGLYQLIALSESALAKVDRIKGVIVNISVI